MEATLSSPRSGLRLAPARHVVPFVLLVSLAYGGLAQGGYHPRQFVLLLGVVTLAGLAGLVAGLPMRVGPVAVGAVLVGCSALLSAWSAQDLSAALPALALVLMVAIVGTLVEAVDADGAELIASGLSLLGVAVACTAWIGVAVRLEPWGRVVDGLWRGSSSLTYSNAAASLIGALLLFTTARGMDDSRASSTLGRAPAQLRLAQFVMIVGLLSTQSRAGIAATGLGVIVLAAGVGPLRLLRTLAGPAFVGLTVAVVLLSSASIEGESRPVLSISAVVAGMTIVAVAPYVRARLGPGSLLGLVAAGLVASLAVGGIFAATMTGGGGSLVEIAERRLTLSSDTASRDVILFGDRAHEWSAAADQFTSRPLLGVGPGQLALQWQLDGRSYRAHFTHNEYLEVAATQGIVGLVAIGCAFALVADGIRSRWRSHTRDRRWAIVSAVIVLLAHSAFDYLWHIPLVPLVTIALMSLALRSGESPLVHSGESDRHLERI